MRGLTRELYPRGPEPLELVHHGLSVVPPFLPLFSPGAVPLPFSRYELFIAHRDWV
jgi:hypothetical protein